MTERAPTSKSAESPRNDREQPPSSLGGREARPFALTPEEQAAIDEQAILERKASLAKNAHPSNPAEAGKGSGHTAHAGHAHGHDGKVVWGAKRTLAIFGYLFSLAWEGIKRWGEMAGKGGGGHAKKADDGHGGGGHH